MTKHDLPRATMEGTRPSPELSETSLPLLRGELPESLRGTYFVVSAVGSPTQTSLQIPRKAPVLNGDGVVYALEFGEEGVKGRARLVENASFVADELVAHAKPGEPGSSFSFCDAGLTRVGGTKLGVRSQSNTALTPFRARGPQSRPLILAGYDAGRPEVIDPCTLKALGPVGSTDLWFSQAFSGSPFPLLFSGAHPVVAHEDGELFMANYQRSFLPGLSSLNQVLLRAGFGVRGGLEGVQPLDTEGFLDAMIASVPREEQERVSSREYDEEACAELVRGVEELEGAEGSLESLERLRIPGIDLLWDLATRAVLDVLKQLRKMGLPTLNPEVYLLRRSSEGLDRFKVRVDPGAPITMRGTMHQIGVTQRCVILADTQFKFDLDLALPFDLTLPSVVQYLRRVISQRQNEHLDLYFIRRSDLESTEGEVRTVAASHLRIKEGGATHWMVDYDDSRGVRLLAVHNHGTDIAEFTDGSDDEWLMGRDVAERFVGAFGGATDTNSFGGYTVKVEPFLKDRGPLEYRVGEVNGSEEVLKQLWGIGLGTGHGQPGLHNGDLAKTYWHTLGLIPGMITKLVAGLYISGRDARRKISTQELRQLVEEGGCESLLFSVKASFDDGPKLVIDDVYREERGAVLGTVQVAQVEEGDRLKDWVLATRFKGDNVREILVFDGDNLAAGPRAVLDGSSLCWPYTLHSCWLDSLGPDTGGLSEEETWAVPVDRDLPVASDEDVEALLEKVRERLRIP